MKVIMRMCIYLEIKVQAHRSLELGSQGQAEELLQKGVLNSEIWSSVLTRGSAAGALSRRMNLHVSAKPATLQGHSIEFADFRVASGGSSKA